MTMQLWIVFSAIFGLLIGSFLNVVILRDDARLTILYERSKCPRCGYGLRWYDLVPVLSYVALGGRCRSCRQRISPQYPLVELGAAALAAVAAYLVPYTNPWAAAALFACLGLLLVVSVIDIRTQLVSLEYCLAALAAAGAYRWLVGADRLETILGVAVGAGIILFIQAAWKLATKTDGMGTGDAYILGAIGALVGWPGVLLALFGGALIGSAIGVPLALARGRDFNLRLPFGPLLSLGAVLVLLWGDRLLYTLLI